MTKTLINIPLIKQAVTAAEANRRQGTSHTKTRANVRGGGKKPWRQKGTGRARAGSSRSPIWVGGGITFGPQKERNHQQNLPKKIQKAAFEELLKLLSSEKAIIVTDSLHLKEPKTKEAVALLKKHGAEGKRVLLVTNAVEAELLVATRNLPKVAVVEGRNLSILDLAHTQLMIIEQKSAEERGLATSPKKEKLAPKKTVK